VSQRLFPGTEDVFEALHTLGKPADVRDISTHLTDAQRWMTINERVYLRLKMLKQQGRVRNEWGSTIWTLAEETP